MDPKVACENSKPFQYINFKVISLGFRLNVEFSVQHFLNLGASKEKLLVGMGTYGRGFRLEV
jgi:hypothetical protein